MYNIFISRDKSVRGARPKVCIEQTRSHKPRYHKFRDFFKSRRHIPGNMRDVSRPVPCDGWRFIKIDRQFRYVRFLFIKIDLPARRDDVTRLAADWKNEQEGLIDTTSLENFFFYVAHGFCCSCWNWRLLQSVQTLGRGGRLIACARNTRSNIKVSGIQR